MGIEGDTQKCTNCKRVVPRAEVKAKALCIPCDRVKTAMHWAKLRVASDNAKIEAANLKRGPTEQQPLYEFTIELGHYRGDLNCELSGVPMVFTGDVFRALEGLSIDRIDRTKGYTPENTRYICYGLNQLRATRDDAYLIAFMENTGVPRAIDYAEITPRVRRKIGDMEKGK